MIAVRCFIVALIGLAAFAAVPAPAADRPTPIVRTAAGSFAGASSGDLRVFKGIRYAQARRWRRPVAVAPSAGVHDATQFGPACFQPPYPATSVYAEPVGPMSEDCLSLNIWAPAKARHAPVIVWIHGGALLRGANSAPTYDGSAIARRGVTLVEINYRLGVFGYLALSDLSDEVPEHVSGNYGLLDQIAALRWVRANVAAFGGDPRNVTVMGESAGGLSVAALLASPLARGLFDKTIVQSAYLNSIPGLKVTAHGTPAAEDSGARIAALVPSGDVVGLRALDAGRLTAMAAKAGFTPSLTVDGWALKRQLVETFERGDQAKVPVIAGSNAGEIRTLRALLPPRPANAAAYRAAIEARYGDRAQAFLALYPESDIDGSMLAALRDAMFGWSAATLARSQAAIGVPSYLYRFDHHYPSADAAGLHAFHASEIPFVFGTLGAAQLPDHWPAPGEDVSERTISTGMIDYWTSFARTGHPVASGAIDWPRYGHDGAFLNFVDRPVAGTLGDDAALRLNDAVVRDRRCANLPWGASTGLAAPLPDRMARSCSWLGRAGGINRSRSR